MARFFTFLIILTCAPYCAAQTVITYSYAEGSSFNGVNAGADTQRHFDQAFDDLEDVCDVVFIRQYRGRADIRITFVSNQAMINEAGAAYGSLTWRNGTMWLNGERRVSPIAARYLVQHEAGHTVFWEYGHNADQNANMHADGSKPISPIDAIWWQSKLGAPRALFYPADRRAVVESYAPYQMAYDFHYAEWLRLKEQRDLETDYATRVAINAQIQNHLAEIRRLIPYLQEYSMTWWIKNNGWRGVPMAHVAG